MCLTPKITLLQNKRSYIFMFMIMNEEKNSRDHESMFLPFKRSSSEFLHRDLDIWGREAEKGPELGSTSSINADLEFSPQKPV